MNELLYLIKLHIDTSEERSKMKKRHESALDAKKKYRNKYRWNFARLLPEAVDAIDKETSSFASTKREPRKPMPLKSCALPYRSAVRVC